MDRGWRSISEGRSGHHFEREVLPAYLGTRRWFAAKGSEAGGSRVGAVIPLGDGELPPVLALIDHASPRGTMRYVMPLVVSWGEIDRATAPPASVVAPVRQTSREGVLIDAVAERDLVSSLVRDIHAERVIPASPTMQLELRPTARFASQELPPIAQVRASGAEQSNSTVIINASFVLKFYRRLSAGTNPELEMGRFLTDVANYSNTPPLLGTIELVEGDRRSAIAVLHKFIDNQGDAWAHAGNYLDRFLEEARVLPEIPDAGDAHAAYLNRMRMIGRRTGELHVALASSAADEAFAPEPVTPADVAEWTAGLVGSAEAMFEELARRYDQLGPRAKPTARALLARRWEAVERMRDMLPPTIAADKIRQHGDFHLGQILIVKDDAIIVDFEGEPERPFDERRRKAPSARDAAGFIRSLDYAATAALHRIPESSGEAPQRLLQALDSWRNAATDAFLVSMRNIAGANRLWPQDTALADRLLRFFVLEKAVYEVGYEFANRPDWVHVPLAGLWRTLFSGEST